MKKKSLIILVVLLVILIPTFVLIIGKEKNNMEKPTSTKLENKEPERGENQGITVNKLEVIYLNPSEAEKTLGTSYTSIKRLKGYKLITVNNEVYLYIGLGKKNTGGYTLEVVNLEDSEGILNVQVNIQQPKEGDIVTQAITYPHKVLKLNFMPTKVNIKSMNTEDTFEEVIPEGVIE
ncbi:hypothetical protein J2Z44_002599 [Clostridium punense]|uniref:PrcB C-terminal domain-containing protein n=1 Tax=Clostridium punense TaxID=1054297 RepID=A0ABS4K694_9CLOT|nr:MULTISPECIES: protease complex subunit PrcB family protein [Clostridium]EQB89411.1 hypothetical protein M918_20425 [Clostridium sp. BL8]MBP2022776.1 hypothetical protein [Clostridium punense]